MRPAEAEGVSSQLESVIPLKIDVFEGQSLSASSSDAMGAVIESVISEAFEIQTNAVHHDHGWLVVEQARDQRARPGEVARRDDDGARVLGAKPPNVRREVRRAPGLKRSHPAVASVRDFEVPVKIVEREDLHVDERAERRCGGNAGHSWLRPACQQSGDSEQRTEGESARGREQRESRSP